MIKKIFMVLFAAASVYTADAQFEVNKHYAGPMIGLSFLGSAFEIGGGYEYGMEIKDFGKIGVGGLIRYWSYSEDAPYLGGEWDYSNFLFGAQGNYHFDVPDRKFDPWAGIAVGYVAGSVEYEGPYFSSFIEPTQGGFWFAFQGGLRYWIQPDLGLTSRIAFGTLGYGSLDVGVDFKF